MENRSILKDLYPKLINREITEQELSWLKQYFNTGDPQEMYALICEELELADAVPLPTKLEQEMLGRVHNHIKQQKFGLAHKEAVRTVKLWPRVVAVAAAVALVVMGVYFFSAYRDTKYVSEPEYANDIAPGTSGATLTIANGKKIKLSAAANGTLAQEAGVKITKTADGKLVYEILEQTGAAGQMNMLATENGETYQLRLPDGSSVWLNAASVLKYPVSFAKLRERRVELSGEAYFEIAKDKSHPFIVKTAVQEVEVLGTHFNINAYEPATATTLLEGSVKVSNPAGRSGMLKPGQQATVLGSEIRVSSVDTDLAIAWKNHEFMFEKESVENIMKMVARWYDVEVIYDVDKPGGTISGSVSRFQNVSKVLQIIESTGQAHFRIEGRRIYVLK